MNQALAPVALFLEDEPLIALDVEDALRSTGFEVVTLSTCQAADRWLVSHTPAVAIVDLELLDGVCHGAAEQLYLRGVPFIIHTGREKTSHDNWIFHQGHWLSKPAASHALALLSRALANGEALAPTR